MRILQVVPSLQLGGAEHVGAFLASRFSETGQLSLIALSGGPFETELAVRGATYSVQSRPSRFRTVAKRFTPLLRLHGVVARRHRSFVGSALQPIMWRHSASSERQEWFKSIVQKHNFDIIHLHTVLCAALAPVAREHARAVVFGQHNILSERHGPEDIDFLTARLQHIDHVVCVSRTSMRDFMAITGMPESKIHIIRNPSFREGDIRVRQHGIAAAGTISNLGPAKGLEVLVAAWKYLSDRNLCVPLKVAGGDSYSVAFWKKHVSALGLSNRIYFLGQLTTKHEIDSFYSDIDLLIVPSQTEAFPLVIPEAYSRGIPVLGSAIPSLRECIFREELLFRSGDPVDLADKIAWLIRNPTAVKESSLESHEIYLKGFGGSEILSEYRTLYSQALSYRTNLAGADT